MGSEARGLTEATSDERSETRTEKKNPVGWVRVTVFENHKPEVSFSEDITYTQLKLVKQHLMAALRDEMRGVREDALDEDEEAWRRSGFADKESFETWQEMERLRVKLEEKNPPTKPGAPAQREPVSVPPSGPVGIHGLPPEHEAAMARVQGQVPPPSHDTSAITSTEE